MADDKLFKQDSRISKLPGAVDAAMEEFCKLIKTIEVEQNVQTIILQDERSGAFYIECHLLASMSEPLLDTDAVLDPDEQVEYRVNRGMQQEHRAFVQMVDDAIKGRQFSDLIVEYNSEYKSAQPLKVLGGQHRVTAIQNALKKGVDRPHGFKIYFALSSEQRNEIAQISNTNIAISTDLLDRMQETMLKSGLRDWCQAVGLLRKEEDFADRKNQEGVITVRVARSFIVNFFEGKTRGYHPDKLYSPYLCRSSIGGGVDEKYASLLSGDKKTLWEDSDLISTGKAFASLHKKQMGAISRSTKQTPTPEYRTKAMTPAVASAFAMISGALSKDKAKLSKLFSLKDVTGQDPLNAQVLSSTRHHTDPETYRGVGTRTDKKDLSRMAEVLIQFVENNKSTLTQPIVELALKSYHAKLANEDVMKAKRKV